MLRTSKQRSLFVTVLAVVLSLLAGFLMHPFVLLAMLISYTIAAVVLISVYVTVNWISNGEGDW